MLSVLRENQRVQDFTYVPQALVEVIASNLLTFLVVLLNRSLELVYQGVHVVVRQILLLVKYETIVSEEAKALNLDYESVEAFH
jgi:hypothetical protein